MTTQANVLQQVENAAQRLGINNGANLDPRILYPQNTKAYIKSIRAVRNASHSAFLQSDLAKIALPKDYCSAQIAEGQKMFSPDLMSLNTWLPSTEAWEGFGTHLAGIFNECSRQMATRHGAFADNVFIKVAAGVATFLTGLFEFIGILAACGLKGVARYLLLPVLLCLFLACLVTMFQDKEVRLVFLAALEKVLGSRLYSLLSNSPGAIESEMHAVRAPILEELDAEKRSKRKYQSVVLAAGTVAAVTAGTYAATSGYLTPLVSTAEAACGLIAAGAAKIATIAAPVVFSPYMSVIGTAATLYGAYRLVQWYRNR